jgi:hypothetical protein
MRINRRKQPKTYNNKENILLRKRFETRKSIFTRGNFVEAKVKSSLVIDVGYD